MGKNIFPFEVVAPAAPEQRRLLNRHPLFFRAAPYPGTHPSHLGLWGITCGPGWYPIIDNAASIIEAELHKLLRRMEIAENLTSIERRLQGIPANTSLGDMGHEDQPYALVPYCSEISERLGDLHIHITAGYLVDGLAWHRMRGAADATQNLAKSICERCGNKGQRNSTWSDHVYCGSCDPDAKR